MSRLPSHPNWMHQYLQDLEACAEGLNAQLNKADELLFPKELGHMSRAMEQMVVAKKRLMPTCRQMEALIRSTADHLRNTLEVYESIDDEIARAFRE